LASSRENGKILPNHSVAYKEQDLSDKKQVTVDSRTKEITSQALNIHGYIESDLKIAEKCSYHT
jgi:hypothetical protein